MENIPLPSKIEILPGGTANQARISIQPCHPGFGTTLGNALRRVMLSSLPGGAVTGFKVKGVSHEFASIDHVKEDMVEVALNLKQVRVKIHSAEPVRLTLKASGEKKVTAGDIKTTSDVEIVNKDLVIATLTDKSADLEMEVIVAQGRGYIPTETREKENVEADLILIDSIFTPVKNVGLAIENVRVGQMTNYENLVLDVETDGTITPREALEKANQVLIEHFNFIAGGETASAPVAEEESAPLEVVEETAVEAEDEESPKAKKAKK